MKQIYESLLARCTRGGKSLAVLIDPDKTGKLEALLAQAKISPPDFFFLGGSLLSEDRLEQCIHTIRAHSDLPIVLFPGSSMQISAGADALLLLSVISGRNADLLIGRHVLAAPMLRKSGLEIISTGYMLVESGASTTVSYISNTQPLPRDKDSIAVCTAMAGEQLGLKLIYLEAGSGARLPVTASMIKAVKASISVPLFVGGGIRTEEEFSNACRAGADVVVVGNVLEENPGLLQNFSRTLQALSA